jgi:hypothetical protein
MSAETTAVPHLLQSTMQDVGALAGKYVELAKVKAKIGLSAAAAAAAFFTAAMLLGVLAIGEAVFAGVFAYFRPDDAEHARLVLAAGGFTLLLAGVLAAVGALLWKRIDLDPIPHSRKTEISR